MTPLAAIERFFERLFERPSARLFRARLQPVQVQRRIERAMESERLAAADRTLVPNRFVVHLHPDDLAGFGDMTGSLGSELADSALVFARAKRYTLVDRPRVELVGDASVQRADIQVIARFADPLPGRQDSARQVGVDSGPGQPGDDVGGGPFDTMVFRVPRPAAPSARLRIVPPGGRPMVREFDGSSMTLGRASDNDVVLPDGRVSRHHARLVGRRGTVVYSDLGSTNGSKVNGVAVGELVLGAGDRIEIGDTVIVLEVAGEGT